MRQPRPAIVPPSNQLVLPSLNISLYDYQIEAFEWAVSKKQSYLALDMGLGKTAIAIAVASALVEQEQQKVLIVVPPSLVWNWVSEISKFDPNLKTAVLRGQSVHSLPDADVYIIGNAVLTHWSVALMGEIDAIIVDEAHFFKNAS